MASFFPVRQLKFISILLTLSSWLSGSSLLVLANQAIKSSDVKESSSVNGFHLDPQIAVLCDYQSEYEYQCQYQYMGVNGKWTSDHTITNHRRRLDSDNGNHKLSDDNADTERLSNILQKCRKAYPNHQITNIVVTTHFVEIGNWCRIGQTFKCKRKEWVKPYRCLEGPFQSDALLVPENCLFDHVHNQSQCWPLDHWNQTASQSCLNRYMTLHSFAMLLPCGLSLFSGVEFVCCPYKGKSAAKDYNTAQSSDTTSVQTASLPDDGNSRSSNIDNDNDEDDSNDYGNGSYSNNDDALGSDVYSDTEETSSGPSSTGQQQKEPQNRQSPANVKKSLAMQAPKMLPDGAIDSVSVQSSTDGKPSSATDQTTTVNPYFTHFNPHEEHKAYKKARKQLQEAHREKVTKVMKDWADLEDRYQEMRAKDLDAAEDFKQRMTLKFQQSVQLLEEEEKASIQQLIAMHQQRINAHIQQQKKEAMNCFTRTFNENPPTPRKVQKCLQKLLRSLYKDRHHTITHYRHLMSVQPEQAEREKTVTMEHLNDISNMMNQSLHMLDRYPEIYGDVRKAMANYIDVLKTKDDLLMPIIKTQNTEIPILNKYKSELEEMQEEKLHDHSIENAENRLQTKDIYEDVEKMTVSSSIEPTTNDNFAADLTTVATSTALPQVVIYEPMLPAVIEHKDVQPRVAHSLTHDLVHNEPIYSFKDQLYTASPHSLHFTVAFAVFTLISVAVIGIAVVRRRNSRSPQNQGFIEVDQAITSEERHVANMQINGYENPTYKYFDIKE